jgi:hypothetical protein
VPQYLQLSVTTDEDSHEGGRAGSDSHLSSVLAVIPDSLAHTSPVSNPVPSLTAIFGWAGSELGTVFRNPYIALDGVEHRGDWHNETRLDVAPGEHEIEVYFRLKGVPVKLGKDKANFTVSEGEVSVRVRFGKYLISTDVRVPD